MDKLLPAEEPLETENTPKKCPLPLESSGRKRKKDASGLSYASDPAAVAIALARRKRLEIRRFRMLTSPEFSPTVAEPTKYGSSDCSLANVAPAIAKFDLGAYGTVAGAQQKRSSNSGCPAYGLVSICGRRREMEDTACAVPSFLELSKPWIQQDLHREDEEDEAHREDGKQVKINCTASVDDNLGLDHSACSSSEESGNHENAASTSLYHFFGVYDGHGGAQVAEFCKDNLHAMLAKEMKKLVNAKNLGDGGGGGAAKEVDKGPPWCAAFEECFQQLDAQLSTGSAPGAPAHTHDANHVLKLDQPSKALAAKAVGSTAVVAVVGTDSILVANCGDSRAVLSRGGRAIPLSNDHKPNRPDEAERIQAAGGQVIEWNGHRVFGVLAMSRAIGDGYLKPYVICQPEVTVTQRSAEDECLILASDGLWDVIPNEVACAMARRCLRGWRSKRHDASQTQSAAEAAAALLTKLAFAKNSKDNISVLVVDLTS